MKKLTKKQAEVLALMRDGWQLARYANGHLRTPVATFGIQQGGIGRGGEARRITASVFNALLDAGLIVCVVDGYQVSKYDAAEGGQP